MFENSQHLWQWPLLIGVIAFLAYTMIVIVEEKKAYLENAKQMVLGPFTFKVPSWWGNLETRNKSELTFKRIDTRYDWVASLSFFSSFNNKQSIEEEMVEKIKNEKIEMDEENIIITAVEQFKNHPLHKDYSVEIVRVEGTGTQDHSERIYFDGYLIRDLKKKSSLYAKSLSSVLNGGVEGPYFEEMMNNLSLTY